MRLRFTTSIASDRGYFHEGRVIEVETLTPEMKRWLERGAAVLERGPEMETTTVPPLPERADAAVGKRSKRAASSE